MYKRLSVGMWVCVYCSYWDFGFIHEGGSVWWMWFTYGQNVTIQLGMRTYVKFFKKIKRYFGQDLPGRLMYETILVNMFKHFKEVSWRRT